MADPTALDIETLTYTILGEARGEGEAGMYAVASVIRNRAKSGLYPSNPVDVVSWETQPWQFSTNNPGVGGNQTTTRAEVRPGSRLYQMAEDIVRTVIYSDTQPADPTGDALFYHTRSVSPSWSKSVTTKYGLITQGNHVFYARSPLAPAPAPRSVSNISKRDPNSTSSIAVDGTVQPQQGMRVHEIQAQVARDRTLPISADLRNLLEAVGSELDVQFEVQSGGQVAEGEEGPRLEGSSVRHDHGHAADVKAYVMENGEKRYLDFTNPADREKWSDIVRLSVAGGATGVGAGTAYMGNYTVHIGYGNPATWGDNDGWVANAYDKGGKTPPLNIPDVASQIDVGGPVPANMSEGMRVARNGGRIEVVQKGLTEYQALEQPFAGFQPLTIDEAIAGEANGVPGQRFDFDFIAERDPLGIRDRGVGSLIQTPQESAERRIYEARREQQYQVAQASMAEATRSAQMTYGAMGQDISNIMGAALPDEIDGVPRVTEEDLFGPAFAPQRLERRTAAPGEGLDDEQIAAIRAVPRSQIIVNAIRPETIGADGALRGSPNNGFVTPLSRQEEAMYRVWKAAYAPDDAGFDYDYRGAFKAGVTPDDAGHWPDTFKKPNHPTFSTDSQYADFAPALAGTWRDDVYIPAPKRMSVTLDEALTPRAILDRISTDAKRRREAEEESPTTTSAPARSVVEDVPLETVVTQDQAEVMIYDARRTALVSPTLTAPRPTSADLFGSSSSSQVMGRLSQTIPATFTAPRLTASEAFGAAVAPQRMGRLQEPTVLVAPTLTRAEMFGAALAPQNMGRISPTVPATLSAPRLTNAEAFGKPVAPQVLARPTSAPGAGLSEAQRQAIRNVVAPAAPPSIPRYVSTPPATPPKLTPIRVGTSYGIPPTPAARPAAKPVSVSGVVKDVTTRLGSVGSTLKTLGNSVQGEVRRVTGQTPTTPPLPKADPRPVAVPPAAKTSAPGAGLTKDQRNAMSALPTVALEVKPAKVSTATVTPQKPLSGKPPVVKQAEQAAQVKKQREAAAPKPAPRPAVTPVPRAAPSTVAPRRSVVQWGRTAPTVRAVGANGAIRSVVAPNGGTVTMGRNGPLNSFTQSSAWWQGQVLGNGGDSNYTNEGISGDGRYGGGSSLSGSV